MDHVATDIGRTLENFNVTAATDSAGSHVVVQSDDSSTHFLSQQLANHEEACELGRRVRNQGMGCYDDWQNMNEMTPLDWIIMLAECNARSRCNA